MTSAFDPLRADAALFDLDGVVTDTAAVHRTAWAAMFEEFLTRAAPEARPYSEADYYELVDGKARAAGVRAVLASRGIELADGSPEDGPDELSVNGLGNRKNDLFAAALASDGVEVFAGTLRLLDAIAEAGIPAAIVSSSRNARAVLETAGLSDRFATVVDGVTAAEEGLAGKPDPDMFLAAAARLEADPANTFAVEDAVSGVASAHAGGFWTVAVDRGAGAEALRAAGADRVVSDPAELLDDAGR